MVLVVASSSGCVNNTLPPPPPTLVSTPFNVFERALFLGSSSSKHLRAMKLASAAVLRFGYESLILYPLQMSVISFEGDTDELRVL